ncbi:TDP-N-acetylfucosamine:lipid II N-acetylfucosaminyltransferase [uncultured Salegentibacter sp.]|uniref:TDP-N-acetylfucosamine:lipid II N-acetylfucosaminyltransferase n=1 Tax=uncultured Salegentibacter sp. TaxID=259320 RepID=UPI002596C69B|nr:TDP-N-acetylfucosamine:lipid II N-acetylfucosaminyltransferase [uncultured Salegentibacter sp.]
MNIHLINREKFTTQFIERFEKFNLNNVYFVIDKDYNSAISKQINIFFVSENKNEILEKIKEILVSENISNLFIHYLDYFKSSIINELSNQFSFKTYWILYGADLYSKLQIKVNYSLYDDESILKEPLSFNKIKKKIYKSLFRNPKKEWLSQLETIKNLDFFCFWNPEDFKLLKNNFNTKANFKFFVYDHVVIDSGSSKFHNKKGMLLVNHSASPTGNHFTILKALDKKQLRHDINQIYLPISYGSILVKNKILTFKSDNLQDKIKLLPHFLSKEEYYNLLRSIDVAFFGHKRQEAGFNIFQLLIYGVKVFLREENNLFKYLSNLGVYIFLFNNDLNLTDIRNNLTNEQKLQNKRIILETFKEEKVDLMYKNILY